MAALEIGTSALLALQRAIATTGHNIANANTEGYSRQRVEFGTLTPQRTGAGFIGNGVEVASITRSYDQFLTNDVRIRTSSAVGAETLADLTGRIDNILADPNTGLGPALDSFFAAVQDVANNPGSLPERQVLLGEGQVLADRFQYLSTRFFDIDQEINVRIDNAVRDINAFAESIAELNDRIARETNSAGGQPPNDLLDERDQLIVELAKRVDVTTVDTNDGAINVLIGSGQALVIGGRAEGLETFSDPFAVSRLNVGVAGLQNGADIGPFLTGGELGAALSFRGDVLDSARTELNLIANGIASTFNAQQGLGVDLDGNFGLDFFQPLAPGISPNINNLGAGSISASVSDVSLLSGDGYRLDYDGLTYTLTNVNTQTSVSGAGPALSLEGLDVTVAVAPSAGDSFFIDPVAQGAALFDVALSDPRAFAAASPLRAETSLANGGNAELTGLSVSSVGSLPLGSAVTLTFNPDALGVGVPGFDVVGIAGGPIAYDPGTDANGITATLGDFSFTLSGVPQDGDVFTIENNADGSGDNRNVLAMADLQSAQSLKGGTASYQDAYASLIAEVGVRTRQASTTASTEAVLLEQSVAARDGVQGVNLDEEAANLIRFQQAYQAAAQVIATADEVFQTLIAATQR